MTYFPTLSIPNFECSTTVFGYPPNDWEAGSNASSLFLHAAWAFDNEWNVIFVKEIGLNNFLSFDQSNFGIPERLAVFLFYSDQVLSGVFETLPTSIFLNTSYPQWRSSINIRSNLAESSYLGEIHPFRNPASCLSFGNLLQRRVDIDEYFILLNLEYSPRKRSESISLFGSEDGKKYDEFTVENNACNVHKLNISDDFEDQTPIFICEKMGGIPLFLSSTFDRSELSLEHTHPPGSMVVHGDRMKCQTSIKNTWFKKLIK